MLLMVEKDVKGEICHAVHRYAKANKKYMKDYDPQNNQTECYSKGTGMLTICMDKRKKLPVDAFRLKKKKYKFTQKFIESYDNDRDSDLPFLPK